MALRRVPLACATIACALAASTFGTEARADEPRSASLGWSRLPGAEACPGARDLALDVEARLGHATFVAPSVADLDVEGRVEVAPSPGAFRATIRLLDRRGALLGTRELETADPTCRDLADPLGLALALMIDPDAAAAEVPTARSAPRPEVPAPWVGAPRLDEPGGVEPAAEPAAPWRFQVDGGLTAAVGLLPRAAAGARLRLLLDPEGFPGIEITGSHFPDVNGGGAVYGVSYAGLGICPFTPDLQVLHLVTCVGASGGALRARGALGSRTDPLIQPYGAVGVVRRIVGPLVGTFDAAVHVPINSHFYNYGEGFHMSPVAGTLDLGLGVEVP